ncbi:50S ribosomal protein L24 [Patescibacteria group bacterium]|nr:50S ribosomal protein L24 [Patescibacteria group bacterium]MBU1966927.1 50S ribosomal protein L24 [Patescibacteria group bacterium]MBU2543725.1 50S ribosomal protein L24 [Patescibacteria group bacterium]
MKFKIGDKILVTAGKDKGQRSEITKILPGENQVVVKGLNLYTKHIRPIGERSGDRVRRERPLSVAKIAIINDQGKVDRIGYKMAKDGTKQRVFKKTSQAVPDQEKKKK